MEDKKKVAKNYLFNTSYQFLALVVPLITTPYISRVLKAEGINANILKFTFTVSCSLFITLRSISCKRMNNSVITMGINRKINIF